MTGSPILLVVPSRGRPEKAAELVEAVTNTVVGPVDLLFGVDVDDPTMHRYPVDRGPHVRTTIGARQGMGGTLNALAVAHAGAYEVIGFCGDDHRPRTQGWDHMILEAARQPGFRHRVIYGDDLIQGANLPTAVFMDAAIIRAIGYMVPPGQRHLYIDNAWKALGEALGTLTYMPGMVIEHMHPIAHKAEWDAGYLEVNDGALYEKDRAAFEMWRDHGGLAGAVAAVRSAG